MSDLDRLFYWRGIAADFFNYRGERVQVSLDNRLALLKSMGVDISSEKKIADAAYKLDVAPWLEWFPPLLLETVSEFTGFTINLHPAELLDSFSWVAESESGVKYTGAFVAGDFPEVGDYAFENVRYSRRKISVPGLAPGYYQVAVTSSSGKQSSTLLAIAPASAYLPEAIEAGEKVWGVVVQLYTLRSETDWGIGDFTVLTELVTELSELGAGTIGLNPLHALLPDLKTKFSPYSPSDRRFLCPLYIDPVLVEEYESYKKAESVEERVARYSKIEALRNTKFVNYCEVANLKYSVFEQLFQLFLDKHVKQDSKRAAEFAEYCSKSGDALQLFALYEAVNNRWQGAHFIVDFDSAALNDIVITGEWKSICQEHSEVILFHSYLQWLAHRQLGSVQDLAKASGMALGLIRDLAVGADGSGAEAVSNPELFCRGASVGAPPDPLAEQGQNWGLPPIDPATLRKTGFAHYINLLRENMSLCGALRIDHAMSMMRLWWCPPGQTADHGAYVYYPFFEMIGLLSLESYRNKCMVVGEDLGVVPDEFREAMETHLLFSNKVFYFEKTGFNKFKHPEQFAPNALAMINNHDVPTLASWWQASDLKLRDELNIFEEGVTYEQMVESRNFDKHEVLNLLSDCELLPDFWADRNIDRYVDEALIDAVLICGAKTASKIYVIQLEDLLMMEDPVNVPGTYLEHANWQRKLTKTVKEIFELDRTKSLLQKISLMRNA